MAWPHKKRRNQGAETNYAQMVNRLKDTQHHFTMLHQKAKAWFKFINWEPFNSVLLGLHVCWPDGPQRALQRKSSSFEHLYPSSFVIPVVFPKKTREIA